MSQKFQPPPLELNADVIRIIIHGARFPRIAPRFYTWIFVSCDILSILIHSYVTIKSFLL